MKKIEIISFFCAAWHKIHIYDILKGMNWTVITNPKLRAQAGFTTSQFKKLDGLYLQAVSQKLLYDRTVECDFDEGVASYTYYRNIGQAPYLQFLIRKVGPNTMMYEVYKYKKGRIKKSGVFDIAFGRLRDEVDALS